MLEVNHSNGRDNIEVDYEKHSGEWAWIGKYFMEKGTSYPIILRPGNESGLLVADAVLLVPERN
jgi:hypothetical protein